MKFSILIWGFLGLVAASNSIEKLEANFGPFLETFWESYLSYPYEYESRNCAYNDLNPEPVDDTAYGYDLTQLPPEVKVVNIAFAAFERIPTCKNYYQCMPYICGLHIFQKSDGSGLEHWNNLKSAIKDVQARGVLVKLAVGGDEWGNTYVTTKVIKYQLHYFFCILNSILDEA